MELFGIRSTRSNLDLAIRAALVAVLLAGGYIVFSMWSHNRQVAESTPVMREIEALQALVREQPGNVVARLQLAQALTIAGRENDAITQYQAVLEVNPDDITSLSGLGFIASKRKQWASAEGYWQRIIDLLEGRPASNQDAALEVACFYMGDVKAEQGKWDEAIPFYKAALRIRRDASDTHYHLAVAYREIGSLSKYEEELKIALAFDPNMPEANYDLGRLLLEQGDVAAAAEHFRISADAAPAAEAPVDALVELGTVEARLAKARELAESDPKAALVEARVAAAIKPDSVEAFVLVARLYEKTGEDERALGAWRKASALDPENAEAAAAIGRLGR